MLFSWYAIWESHINTSLAAPGALAHRLQRRTTCNAAPPAKSKMAARVSQNGRSKQLSLNKFFDPTPPSMRKVDNIGNGGGEGEELWPLTPTARAN